MPRRRRRSLLGLEDPGTQMPPVVYDPTVDPVLFDPEYDPEAEVPPPPPITEGDWSYQLPEVVYTPPLVPPIPEPVLFEPEEAPEIEDVPELPPEPTDEGPTAMEERRRLQRRRGFRSTVQTSPQGILGKAPVVRRTLLGGA